MSKDIPTITHRKNMSPCIHRGESWNVALALVMQCTGVTATIPQRNTIVQELIRGRQVWLGGNLLQGELT